jgi:tRNA(Ile)-lysidine synthase TilS/MesJ
MVTFDNGFVSEEGLNNIKAIVNNLSVDHVYEGLDWEELRNLYRECFLRTGEFCSVCNVGIRAMLYRVTRQHGIHNIVAGTSPRTEADVPDEYFCCSNSYFTNVFKDVLTSKQIREFMYVNQIQRGLWHLTGKVCWIQIPRYIPWKEDEILAILKKEVGWQGEEWQQHTDCTMSNAKADLKLTKFGVIEKTSKLSSLIRDGQMEREKALEIVRQDEADLMQREDEIVDQIMDTFQLTKKDFEKGLQSNHCDYLPKSNEMYKKVKSILYH